MLSFATVNRLLESGRMKRLSVCVEGKTAAWERAAVSARWIDGYDVGKRVILKDASVERIEAWLSENSIRPKTDERPR